jgi:hypothetical protein
MENSVPVTPLKSAYSPRSAHRHSSGVAAVKVPSKGFVFVAKKIVWRRVLPSGSDYSIGAVVEVHVVRPDEVRLEKVIVVGVVFPFWSVSSM